MTDILNRDETPVMFRRARDESAAIRHAWAELEATVGSLRGRKFFGAFDPATGEYRACTQLRDDDDPDALGLEVGTLPGGPYLRERLKGEPPEIYERIGPTFDKLVEQAPCDETRPSIEFYRSRDVIDLLLPVKGLGEKRGLLRLVPGSRSGPVPHLPPDGLEVQPSRERRGSGAAGLQWLCRSRERTARSLVTRV